MHTDTRRPCEFTSHTVDEKGLGGVDSGLSRHHGRPRPQADGDDVCHPGRDGQYLHETGGYFERDNHCGLFVSTGARDGTVGVIVGESRRGGITTEGVVSLVSRTGRVSQFIGRLTRYSRNTLVQSLLPGFHV